MAKINGSEIRPGMVVEHDGAGVKRRSVGEDPHPVLAPLAPSSR